MKRSIGKGEAMTIDRGYATDTDPVEQTPPWQDAEVIRNAQRPFDADPSSQPSNVDFWPQFEIPQEPVDEWMPLANYMSQRCRDVMTDNPIACQVHDKVDQVAQVMEREDIGSVPIVNKREENKLVGIVTDRDLTLKVVAQGLDSRQTRVEEVMTSEVVTCHPDDDIEQALQVMTQFKVRRVPVLDDEGRLVGIIAQADIALRVDDPDQTAELVEEISQPLE